MRYYTDCREAPSEMNCTVAISADSKKETVEAAVNHMVDVHQHDDTPQLRQEVEKLLHQTEQDIPSR